MTVDLKYTNRAGISLQNVLDVLVLDEGKGKKDIQADLDTTKNIDILLKKLEDASLINKKKEGNKLLYTVSKKKEDEPTAEPKVVPTTQTRVVNKAKPTRTKTPAEVNEINKQTASITKDHQITTLVEVEEKHVPRSQRGMRTVEVGDNELETLKKEMESKLGKEVTAVLHKRKDRAVKKRKESVQKIYETQQSKIEVDGAEFEKDNPYRFVLNFFVSTLNGEKATPYFRRRDEYVVKSIYNKFKALCDKVEDYKVSPQHLPFYRVITINMDENAVKMYHIDMNRVVRGVHTIFKLNQFDGMFIKFKD